MKAGGRQIDKKERPIHDSEWDQNYGKATRDALISEDSKFEGDEGDSYGGKKTRNSFPFPVGSYEFKSDMGREIKACWGTKVREERSPASKSKDVGDEISQVERKEHPVAECLEKVAGTWPMLATKARRILPTQQEKEVIGLGLTDCRSGAGEGSALEVDRAQGRKLEVGQPNQTGPGPKSSISSSFNELGSCGHTCSRAAEKGVGLRQEMQLRSPLQQNHKCSCSIDADGNDKHNWKVGENREDHSQENECLNIHRYDDNIYEQPTSTLISVFGRPLLPGDFSGRGGINGEDDLEPLRVVAADGRTGGVEYSGALIEEGEGLVPADRRTNEVQNEASEFRTYERWEKSCLEKFSDFLGFPTKGFEKEITNLLRNLVNAQKFGKGKECQSLSKGERELRKLKWTINYKGKETSREDGRDRGQLILKLK